MRRISLIYGLGYEPVHTLSLHLLLQCTVLEWIGVGGRTLQPTPAAR